MPKQTFLYGITDDKYVKSLPGSKKEAYALDTFKFSIPEQLDFSKKYDENDVSTVFKAAPSRLHSISRKFIDEQPLLDVYNWTIEDICRWLRECGFPQYQRAFRENMINGNKLLLVDANVLVAMNIKDFEHIKSITSGIKALYKYNVAKYGRSISLPPEHTYELYKLFRTQTGNKYAYTKCSDYLQSINVLSEEKTYFNWDALEHHLKAVDKKHYRTLFGTIKTKQRPEKLHSDSKASLTPSKCFWKSAHRRSNSFSTSASIKTVYPGKTRLDLLERLFPYKYGAFLYEIYEFEAQVVHFHARKSSVSASTTNILGA